MHLYIALTGANSDITTLIERERSFVNRSVLPTDYRCRGFLSHLIVLIHTTLGGTALDEGSARCKDLYPTTHNTHKKETSMLPAGFEPAIPTSEWP